MPSPETRHIRHTPHLRHLQVVRCERLSPHLRRVVFGGAALAGFDSPAADDHLTLFFPDADGHIVLPQAAADGAQGRQPSPARDFSVASHDPEVGELAVDFVLHGNGVASRWAAAAQAGDALVLAGPQESLLVADDFTAWVLIGDETALPAIARRLAELPAHVQAEVLIEIPEEMDRLPLPSAAQVNVTWFERNGVDAASSTLLEDALVDFEQPDADAFYWIALESRRAEAMRQFFAEHLQVPAAALRASGYWTARAG